MKRKKRKGKWITADEGYDYGPLRLMRFGRFTVLLRDSYFLTKSARAQMKEPGFDVDREHFTVSAEMRWLAVRGPRYLAHDLPSFRDLFSPHDDELDKLFGLTTEDILGGLAKIFRNLTRGHLDAFKELERFRLLTLEAVGRYVKETGCNGEPRDLTDQVIETHGWHEWRDRVMKDALGFDLFDITSTTGWPTKLLDRLSWRPGGGQ
jgi:hypothetical protein